MYVYRVQSLSGETNQINFLNDNNHIIICRENTSLTDKSKLNRRPLIDFDVKYRRFNSCVMSAKILKLATWHIYRVRITNWRKPQALYILFILLRLNNYIDQRHLTKGFLSIITWNQGSKSAIALVAISPPNYPPSSSKTPQNLDAHHPCMH